MSLSAKYNTNVLKWVNNDMVLIFKYFSDSVSLLQKLFHFGKL